MDADRRKGCAKRPFTRPRTRQNERTDKTVKRFWAILLSLLLLCSLVACTDGTDGETGDGGKTEDGKTEDGKTEDGGNLGSEDNDNGFNIGDLT